MKKISCCLFFLTIYFLSTIIMVINESIISSTARPLWACGKVLKSFLFIRCVRLLPPLNQKSRSAVWTPTVTMIHQWLQSLTQRTPSSPCRRHVSATPPWRWLSLLSSHPSVFHQMKTHRDSFHAERAAAAATTHHHGPPPHTTSRHFSAPPWLRLNLTHSTICTDHSKCGIFWGWTWLWEGWFPLALVWRVLGPWRGPEANVS